MIKESSPIVAYPESFINIENPPCAMNRSCGCPSSLIGIHIVLYIPRGNCGKGTHPGEYPSSLLSLLSFSCLFRCNNRSPRCICSAVGIPFRLHRSPTVRRNSRGVYAPLRVRLPEDLLPPERLRFRSA